MKREELVIGFRRDREKAKDAYDLKNDPIRKKTAGTKCRVMYTGLRSSKREVCERIGLTRTEVKGQISTRRSLSFDSQNPSSNFKEPIHRRPEMRILPRMSHRMGSV